MTLPQLTAGQTAALRDLQDEHEAETAARRDGNPLRTGGGAASTACDIDSVALQLTPAAGASRAYRCEGAEWHWAEAAQSAGHRSYTAQAGGQPSRLPRRLHLSSPASGTGCARLHVRLMAEHRCDPALHPRVALAGPDGEARGYRSDNGDTTLELHAAAETPADGGGSPPAPEPVMAVETAARSSVLQLHSCGLLAGGGGLGGQRTEVFVYPAQQTLLAWRRHAGVALDRCRVERDGLPLHEEAWSEGLRALDRQLADALARLGATWQRHRDIAGGAMQAAPVLLGGTAGLTWGWIADPAGPTAAPTFRVAGALDLLACRLDLRLHGGLSLLGSSSHIQLQCPGQAVLRLRFDTLPAPAALQARFRLPFVADVQAVAQPDEAVLLQATGPVEGAVVGSCGLRPRPDQSGLQWFCQLAVEAVSLPVAVQDPLRGRLDRRLPLLPAQDLLDWSLG